MNSQATTVTGDSGLRAALRPLLLALPALLLLTERAVRGDRPMP